MPAAVLPVAARAVEVLVAAVLPVARGQDPVVREVPEPAAAVPGAVVAEDETLELPPGAVVEVKAVEAEVQGVAVEAVPANQPKTPLPARSAFPPSSLCLLRPPFPFLFP